MQKEERGNNFINLFRNFWYFSKLSFKDNLWLSVTVFTLPAILGALPIFSSKIFSVLVDSIVDALDGGLLDTVWKVLIYYFIVKISLALLWSVQSFFGRKWHLRLGNILDIFLSKKRMKIDIANFENPKFQNEIQRAFNNGYSPIVEIVDGFVDMTIYGAEFIAASIAILSIDWRLFFIVLVASIPSFIVEMKNGSRIWSIFSENSQELRMYQTFKPFLTARFSVIEGKIFQLQDNFLRRIKKILFDFTEKQVASDKKILKFRIISNILAITGILLAIIIIIRGTILGEFSIGSIVFFLSVVDNFDNAISRLLSRIAKLLERNLFATDIYKIINTKPIIKIKDNAVKIEHGTPTIEFRNVSFKYPGKDNYVLENVSFKINAGEKIGLVGLNGAGKTTIVRLLLRIHDPNKGQVLVDGIDIKDIDLDDWWSKVGVLLQDFSSIHLKTREAIACGRVDEKININLVNKSAQRSTANDFIEKWPKKYEEMIGVEFGGEELSKGERQKMALARVFYRNANFMILDEPTASIDASSASKIFENIRKLPENISALLISHNFATIKLANRIMLIEHGKITEEGTHDELMKINGTYACLYKQQEKDFTC